MEHKINFLQHNVCESFSFCWQRHRCVAKAEGRGLGGGKDADPASRGSRNSEIWLEQIKLPPRWQDFSAGSVTGTGYLALWWPLLCLLIGLCCGVGYLSALWLSKILWNESDLLGLCVETLWVGSQRGAGVCVCGNQLQPCTCPLSQHTFAVI